MIPSSLIDALLSDGPATDRAERMGLYAFLVGSWDMEAVIPTPDGSTRTSQGEIHAGWVLGGRAIQDVWILPSRAVLRADPSAMPIFHGTTLRVYDPGLDGWHILWSDPVRPLYRRQIGRARGKDIVQEGKDDAGVPTRWSFSEITASSFHWLGERAPDGTRWQTEIAFFARRVAG